VSLPWYPPALSGDFLNARAVPDFSDNNALKPLLNDFEQSRTEAGEIKVPVMGSVY